MLTLTEALTIAGICMKYNVWCAHCTIEIGFFSKAFLCSGAAVIVAISEPATLPNRGGENKSDRERDRVTEVEGERVG